MTFHRQGLEKNVFIFSTARSGTTWLSEVIATQGRFKIVNEPFNLRWPVKREALGLTDWEELLFPANRPAISRYIESFMYNRDRDVRFKRETPFTDFWHLYTDRIIFKILFAGEDCINWVRDEFNGQIILLLRHPIPVSLSRNKLPRLKSFLTEPYSKNFTAKQLSYAKTIVDDGDHLQTAVLDWCLQNTVRLRSIEPDWLVMSYEQFVIQPDIVVRHLASKLSLPNPEEMMDRVFVASGSTGMSTEESKRLLLDPDQMRQNRMKLIDRWKNKVTLEQETRAFDTLRVFGIDFYERGNLLPKDSYLLTSDCSTIL
jgi:hypothetical protein